MVAGPTIQSIGVVGPTTALVLGGFTFQEWELPEDLGPFGGYRKLVEHEYAGGIVIIQDQGLFPPKMIKWKGAFTHVQNSSGQIVVTQYQRLALAYNALLNPGTQMSLTFGPFSYVVAVEYFYPGPKNEFYIPYEICIRPIADTTSWSTTAPNSTGPIMNQNSPLFTSNAQSTLPTNNGALANLINNSQLVPFVNSGTVSQLSNFQQALNNALQTTLSGSVSSTPDLQQAIADAQSALNLDKSGTGPAAAFSYQASDLLNVINQALTPTPNTITTGTLINPDLQALAARYYGDSSLWTLIAANTNNIDQNGNRILVPNLIGEFNLTIPQNTAAPVS